MTSQIKACKQNSRMKKKVKPHPGRKKRLKPNSTIQNLKSKYPICCRESSGTKILKKLSEVFGFTLKIWKANKLVNKFGPPDVDVAKKIDVVFRPDSVSGFGEWFLKNKRSTTSGKCVYQLVADKIKSSPHYLQSAVRSDLQSAMILTSNYQAPDERGAATWLNISQGQIDITGLHTGKPRSNASRYLQNPDFLGDKSCIEKYTSRIMPKVELPGFLSYQQQDYFAHLTFKSQKFQNMLNYFLGNWSMPGLQENFSFSEIGITDPKSAGLFGSVWADGGMISYKAGIRRGPFRDLYRMTGLQLVLRKYWNDPFHQQVSVMVSEFFPHLEMSPIQGAKKVLFPKNPQPQPMSGSTEPRPIFHRTTPPLHRTLARSGFDPQDLKTYNSEIYDEFHANALLNLNGRQVVSMAVSAMCPRASASYSDRSTPINDHWNSCIENSTRRHSHGTFGFLSYRQQNWLTHVALCTQEAQNALRELRRDDVLIRELHIPLLGCGFTKESLPFGGVWRRGIMVTPFMDKIRFVKLTLGKFTDDSGPERTPFAIIDCVPLV